MRFRLTLSNSNDRINKLPFNYQYPISSWIYKVFNHADPSFAFWLHEKGYVFSGSKKFKLFTFSHLDMQQFRINKKENCFNINGNDVNLDLSFFMEDAAEKFITGIFKEQQCDIADRKHKASFRVSHIERLPEPVLEDEAVFKCLSPICIARPEKRNGRLYAQYLSPEDKEYEKYFFDHLLRKYITSKAECSPVLPQDSSPDLNDKNLFQEHNFKFTLLNKPKSRLITVKAGTLAETKVRGFVCRFILNAPAELLDFATKWSIGEKGSVFSQFKVSL